MIPGSYYLPIYLLIVSIATFVVCIKYQTSSLRIPVKDNSTSALWMAIVWTIFIGLRPNDPVFADTVGYVAGYYENLYQPFVLSADVENLLFENIYLFFASYDLGWHTLFLLLSSIYFIGTYIACHKFFPKNTLLAYLVFLGAFSTFSYSTNGMKAGDAAALFLCALAYRTEKPILASILALASYGFHHSMTPCVATFFIVWFYNNPKWYFLFWTVCLILSAAHVTFFQTLFAGYSDKKGASYLDMDNMAGWEGKTGFRLDFVIYSAMPILVGYWAIFIKKVQNIQYNQLLCSYLFMNGIWLLCMYAGFTNRIAYLSWFMYPIVLIYPLLDKKCRWGNSRFKTAALFAGLHLGFTLFMNIIYL